MGFIAAQCSFRGARDYNEDAVCSLQTKRGFVAVVADGLGGCGGGDIASQTAVKSICELFEQNNAVSEENIQQIFAKTNRIVCEQQTAEQKMKSTAVALFHSKGRLAAAHVGDSRLYLLRGGKIIFQTQDHSVSQMAVLSKEITAREIRFHADRNKVLRALGEKEAPVRPDIAIFEACPLKGDAFLLCTDGFWEYVWEEEMEAELAKSSTPGQWISKMVARIAKRMTDKNDNFSAVALFYQ